MGKKIAFNYFGGKYMLLENLYSCMPSDIIHFVDVFGGSFVVSLNYPKRIIRTANEINQDITNFFEVLRDNEEELIHMLRFTPCSYAEYNKCWEYSSNKIEQARRFYVRVRQSFFGLSAQRKNKGWHMAKSQINAKGGETVSRWNNSIDKLMEVATLIRHNFQITPYSYEDCIDKIDFKGAFFYCDPPYLHRVRTGSKDYMYEFSDEDHIALSIKLNQIKGKAMVSSYDSKFYDELYKDWFKEYLPIRKTNIKSSVSQEVIYMNYEKPSAGLFSQLHKNTTHG